MDRLQISKLLRVGAYVLLVMMIVTIVALLSGCAPHPERGTIHDKQYVPAWVQMVIAGKSIIPIYHPAEYEFDIYASPDDHGWIDVNENTYNHYNIGDYFKGEK